MAVASEPAYSTETVLSRELFLHEDERTAEATNSAVHSAPRPIIERARIMAIPASARHREETVVGQRPNRHRFGRGPVLLVGAWVAWVVVDGIEHHRHQRAAERRDVLARRVNQGAAHERQGPDGAGQREDAVSLA